MWKTYVLPVQDKYSKFSHLLDIPEDKIIRINKYNKIVFFYLNTIINLLYRIHF